MPFGPLGVSRLLSQLRCRPVGGCGPSIGLTDALVRGVPELFSGRGGVPSLLGGLGCRRSLLAGGDGALGPPSELHESLAKARGPLASCRGT